VEEGGRRSDAMRERADLLLALKVEEGCLELRNADDCRS
jgi:hypothetical protein